VTPISYADAWPILEHLSGPESPRDWQGSLPFTYHLGPGPVKVHVQLKQDFQFRTIWDVIGRIPGSQWPDEWVVAGNHRDAWVYGAVDPNSGTAAMLEAVHGVGELLKAGWKPKRTLIFGSWDAEEEGLIGSTEWGEQHAAELANAAAYFNVDVAVAGPKFGASSVPTLKQFIRDVSKAVPSPKGGSLYDVWKKTSQEGEKPSPQETASSAFRPPAADSHTDASVGDLGSGSDYTVFLQHLGVPSGDIGSTGPYGVYHSVFDNFSWFRKFGDPDFLYEQQMARVFGLEAIRMAGADMLPYDYPTYAREIRTYIEAAKGKSDSEFGSKAEGLPNRPWFRHAIYAPGQYTGYAAVVIPGVNEAIDKHDLERTTRQIQVLADALNRAARVLERH
jgi:N-acetylated-alpha-linked acidic dipeptidase